MKSLYGSHRAAKQGVSLLFVISLFFLSLSIQADDLPTAEPAPETTTEPIINPLPTEDPAPVVTVEPPVITPEATLEITPQVTPEITPQATVEITPQATVEPSPVTPVPTEEVTQTPGLPLLFLAAFEGSDSPGLSSLHAWVPVQLEEGKAVQNTFRALPVYYETHYMHDGAVEADLWVSEGEGRIILGHYTAALSHDGILGLYREGGIVDWMVGTTDPVTETWMRLRLEVAGSQVTISLNGTPLLTYTETTPLPAGRAGFTYGEATTVRVDNFAVYGTPDTTVVIPPAVTLLEPADGGEISYEIGMTWQEVPDVYGYELDISSDPAFSTLANHYPDLSNPWFNPVGLASGTYYWRVRIVLGDGIVGPWTSRMMILPLGLDAPVVRPATPGSSGRPRFNYEPVPSGTHYIIEMNDVCADGTPLQTFQTTNLYFYPYPNNLPPLLQGEYGYCIKASDGAGNEGPFSAQHSVKVTYNDEPSDNDSWGNNIPLPLIFGGIPNSSTSYSYKFYIDTEPTFSAPILWQSNPVPYTPGTQGNRATAPAITTPGTYYWRVERLINGVPEPIYSLTSFTLNIVSGATAPVLTGPANGAYISGPTLLTWTSPTTPPSFEFLSQYRLQISTSPSFSSLFLTQDIGSYLPKQYNFVPAPNTNNQTYYWRVMGIDVRGRQLTPVQVQSFSVDNTPLPPPTVISPAANATLNAPRPTFTWNAVSGSNGYVIALQDSATLTDIITERTVTGVSFKAPEDLPAGSYVLRIRSTDLYGNIGTFTTVAFTLDPIVLPPLPAPAVLPAQSLYSGYPTFNWTSVPDAAGYIIEINDVCGDESPLYSYTTTAASSYAVPTSLARLPQGQYSYCIQAIDAQGNNGLYSAPQSLKIAYNYAPLDDETRGTNMPILLNYYSYGNSANTYKFYIDNEPTFTAPFIYQSGIIGYYNGIGLHTAPTIATPGVYYWRVERFINGVPEPTYSLVSFKLNIGASGSAPVLTAPANGAFVSGPILLTWNPSTTLPGFATITHYQVQISTTSNFSSGVTTQNISVSSPQQYNFVPPANTNGLTHYWRVMGIDANGQQITLTQGRTFSVDNVPLAPPTITSPVPYASFNLVRPSFTWTGVSGANGYILAVKNNHTTTDIIAEQAVTTLSFTSPIDFPAGSYTLRVRSRDVYGNVGAFATVPFHVSVSVITATPTPTKVPPTATPTKTPTLIPTATATAVLAPPTLQQPAAEALIHDTQPVLTWDVVPGVSSYIVQIYVDDIDQVGNPVLVTSGSVTSPSYTPSTPLQQGHYKWRVMGVGGSSTPWSQYRSFFIDVSLSPVSGSVISPIESATTVDVPFTWMPVNKNVSINVIGFNGSDAQCSADSATSTCTVSNLGYGTYVWAVSIEGETIIGSDMLANVFHVRAAAPRAVTLTSPLNGHYLQPDERPAVVLGWNWGASPAPAGGDFTYNVQIDTSTAFTAPIVSADGLTAPTFTTSSLSDGTYYWRAQAVNSFGTVGAWSEPFSFIYDSVPPLSAPMITLPAPNLEMDTLRPPTAWQSVVGADYYTVEINDVCGDGTPLYVSAAPITSTYLYHDYAWDAPELLQGQYTVCVTAHDLSGNKITSSRVFKVFIGLTPDNGSFIVSGTAPVFYWTTANEIDETLSFKVQIDPTGDDFTSSDVMTSASTNAWTLTWSKPLPAGTYHWRVLRLVNGIAQGFSTPVSRVFHRSALAAGPALVYPANEQFINDVTDFTWNAAAAPSGMTITHYEIQVSRSTNYAEIFTSEIVPADGPLSYLFNPLYDPFTYHNNVKHYWRVRGLFNETPVTSWSINRSVRVDNVPTAQPQFTSPAPDALVNTTRPSFKWPAVSQASQYLLEIYVAGTSTLVYGPILGQSRDIKPTINLPQGDYTAQLSTNDGHGNWSGITVTSFTVRLGTAPAQDAILTTARPSFSWKSVLDATSYTLQIDDNYDFSSPILEKTVTGTSYTLTNAQKLLSGTYFWRMKSDNVDYPPEQSSRSFSISLP